MARDKAKSGGVKFTRESALAIAATVRAVQGSSRNQDSPPGRSNAQAASHYLSKTTAAWTKGTKQTLTLHVGEGGAEAVATGNTVDAWNYIATLPSGVWVVIARANGTFYAASFDFTGLPNYSAGKQQALGHAAAGGLAWIDTTACT